jgi:hypothetical protein
LTFEGRISFIVKLLALYKTQCDEVMKSQTIEQVVAMPIYKLQIAAANKKNNAERAMVTNKGREAINAEKLLNAHKADGAQKDLAIDDSTDTAGYSEDGDHDVISDDGPDTDTDAAPTTSQKLGKRALDDFLVDESATNSTAHDSKRSCTE